MERDRERLKLLGAVGMFMESFCVISARRKLFARILFALILPICLLLLAQSKVTQLMLEQTVKTDVNHRPINYGDKSGEYAAALDTRYGWAITLAIKVVYFTVVEVLSLLPTSAVVYTVASVYASKDVKFKKVMRAVPKVWGRLIVTLFWIFLIYAVYSSIFVVLCVCAELLMRVAQLVGVVLAVLLVTTYAVGMFYITIIYELACVVSVLEDGYGRKAISKSRALLRGKLWSVVGCFVLLCLWFGLVELGFECLVSVVGIVIGSVALRVVAGIIFWFLLALENLYSLVVITVIYFVCKSYHGPEDLDMFVDLANRLEVYHDTKEAPLEQSHV